MTVDSQFNIKPAFQTTKLPCEGVAGDLLVLSPVPEGDYDSSPQGRASLWFCTKSSYAPENVPAVWKRVQFDGFADCGAEVPEPPQDVPPLNER